MVTLYRKPIYDDVQSARAGFDWYEPGPLKAYLFGFIRIPLAVGQWVNRWL